MGLLDEDAVVSSVMSELGFEEEQSQSQDTGPTLQLFEPEPNVAPTVVQAMNEQHEELQAEAPQTEEETEIDLELTEAEERLAKAQLYKQFIVGNIFDGNGPGVKEVSNEFRDFARRQLQILLGVVPKVDESHFTEDEVKVIKIFIARILQNPKLIDPPKPKTPQLQSKPVSRPVAQVAPPPVQKPAVAPPKKPQLRSRQVPEEAQAQPTQKAAPKASKEQVKAQPAKQVAKPAPRPTTPQASLPVPADESIVEENGQKFKIHYRGMPNIDIYGIMDGGKIRTLGEGQSCMLSNGIQVLKSGNEVTQLFRTLVVPNQNTPGRRPFPSIEEMAQVSLNNATQQASRLPISQGRLSVDKVLGRQQ